MDPCQKELVWHFVIYTLILVEKSDCDTLVEKKPEEKLKLEEPEEKLKLEELFLPECLSELRPVPQTTEDL